jgi:hypothetical protein
MSSAIGRITAALASATNDITVAAAAVNFDFSLVKVEAPAEFHALGKVLSDRRRFEAENGAAHVTARKLGALFEHVGPSAPDLIKAYGRRVSEISESLYAKSGPPTSGIFASHAGMDGTSIWAAATSGPGAISIQLLTCMLARLWKSPEAVSVWVELVRRRKQDITESFERGESVPFATLQALRIELTREQLANWDASARAWLLVADQEKHLEQKRLMLILNNIHTSVDDDMHVYESVIKAWTAAIIAMNNLAKGVPQAANNGAVLLGLSAWHLYPDIVVLGATEKQVSQRDSVVPAGGVLTIGLQSPAVETGGISWCLSLAHLRYYGDPVIAKATYSQNTSRISFDELSVVTFGSILSDWAPLDLSNVQAAQLLLSIRDFFETEDLPEVTEGRQLQSSNHPALSKSTPQLCENAPTAKANLIPHWISLLFSAADLLLNSKDVEYETFRQLVEYGKRRAKWFLAKSEAMLPPPLFGLLHCQNIIPLLKSDNERIEFLRDVAKEVKLDKQVLLIRYLSRLNNGETQYAYCTALPRRRRNLGVDSPSKHEEGAALEHARWIRMPEKSKTKGSPTMTWNKFTEEVYDLADDEKDFLDILICKDYGLKGMLLREDLDLANIWGVEGRHRLNRITEAPEIKEGQTFYWVRPMDDIEYSDGRRKQPTEPSLGVASSNLGSENKGQTHLTSSSAKSLPRYLSEWLEILSSDRNTWKAPWIPTDGRPDRGKCDIPTAHQLVLTCSPSPDLLGLWDWRKQRRPVMKFTYVYGDRETAALYMTRFDNDGSIQVDDNLEDIERGVRKKDGLFVDQKDSIIILDTFKEFITQRKLSSRALASYLWGGSKHMVHCKNYHRSLNALSIVARLYKSLPGATIDISVTTHPLHEAGWVPQSSTSTKLGDIACTFSCIATFDTGTAECGPEKFRGVLAVCSGDSIYASAACTRDPYEEPGWDGVRRIIGNVGQAGFAILIPPKLLRHQKYKPENWRLVGHADFDGKMEDCFQNTSLHLSFTGYKQALDITSHHGDYEQKFFYLEAVISVHDRGKWIGDIDVVTACSSPLVQRIRDTPKASCSHLFFNNPAYRFTQIDNWEEFIDVPDRDCVFRAHKNWLARLAATALSVQRNQRTVIIPYEFCWQCCRLGPRNPDMEEVMMIC